MKQFVVFSFVVCVTLLSKIEAEAISCKDEQGQDVDWFYVYKAPYLSPYTKGNEYIYLKPGSTKWTLASTTVDLPTGILGRTIVQAYSKESDPNKVVVAFNDSPPGLVSSATSGHTKGLLVADDQSGVWVIHTVPLFPNITENPDEYDYPWSGRNYGQNFLCISVKAAEVDKIGLQFIYNEPFIYTFKISDNLRTLYPNLVKAFDLNQQSIPSGPYNNLATIVSAGGVPFQSFAKGRNFRKELYSDWVAPTLGTDLYVQAWRFGTNLLPSNCSEPGKVWNISDMLFEQIDLSYTTLNDHSKWAVNDPTNQTPWACVGDINRASYQSIRGGGTVCLSSPVIASAYFSLITDYETC